MITLDFIHAEYTRVLSEVTEVLPLKHWVIQPTTLVMTSHKSKYGTASPAGEIAIAEIFLGTTAYQKLDFVLRHEFAHLAVGLHHHHNKKFRRYERAFGVSDTDLSEDLAQLNNKISFKYTVIAHLENGEQYNFGGVHRKTKRYSQYERTDKRFMTTPEGHPIERFEFIEN